jgi:uncharacterized membrane protein YfcA
LLLVTIPAAILGTWLSARIPPDILKIILGVGLVAVGLSFLRAPDHAQKSGMDDAIQAYSASLPGVTSILTAEGEEIRYRVCNRTEGMTIAGVGALFMGLISTGLGEMNGYFLLQRCRVPSKVAVATSVFVVAVSALTAAGGHLARFIQDGGNSLDTVLSITLFTVPGVILGGQIGSSVASRISQHLLEKGLGLLFLIVAFLTLIEVIG